MLSVLEKINVIVNFDFKLPILFDDNHLNCFPELFHKYFQQGDVLHGQYFKLPTECPLRLADNDKKLDCVINQKKINFVIGPLLNYFINSINSIHQQMDLTQITKIYHAVRTLRFCLRKIFPVNSPSITFNSPKLFDPKSERLAAHCKDIADELKQLLEEMKYYQCVLFTELHYEFVNCLLDFSFMVEGIMDSGSESYKPISNLDSLIVIDPVQFINSFSTIQFIAYQYHPDTEVQFLKNALRDNWIHTLHNAFRGMPTERNEHRIIKEINNFLPILWGLRTFDEAVVEAAKLYYSDWNKSAQNDRSGWYEKFCKTKFAGIVWLNMFHLPYTKAVEELQKYENMLKNEFACTS